MEPTGRANARPMRRNRGIHRGAGPGLRHRAALCADSVAPSGLRLRVTAGAEGRQICTTDKIPLSPSGKSFLELRTSRPTQRGVSRTSRTSGRDAVDVAGALTTLLATDGEVVWS